jgi:hypothetical protein
MIRRTCLLGLLTLAVALPTVGCSNSATSGSPGDAARGDDEQLHAITVGAVSGINHRAIASQQARDFTAATGLTGFWVEGNEYQSYVYYGRYPSRTDTKARRDLETLKDLAAARRFRPSMIALTPVTQYLPTADGNAADAWDLRNSHPDAVYTLQVGYYDEDFPGDRRRAAEAEVKRIREEEGFQAYYYHGPNRSMVMLYAFGEGAFRMVRDDQGGMRREMHPQIIALVRKFPLNLRNGEESYIADPGTGHKVTEKSGLVRIPGR